jgi:hypothetical protein
MGLSKGSRARKLERLSPVTIMNMLLVTLCQGIVLGAMGIAGYLYSGAKTSLIPTLFGVLFLVCAIMGEKLPNWRKHVMHLACVLGLIGFVVPARALGKFYLLVTGSPVERPLAILMQSLMAVLCLVYLILCVRSFVDVRRAKKMAAEPK